MAPGLYPFGLRPASPVGLKVSHFLPFGKDCPVPGRVGAGGPQGEPPGSDSALREKLGIIKISYAIKRASRAG